jgi:Secretion system C-terminal sorting domain
MLALAHSAKGILFYKYSSTNYPIYSATCQDSVWFDAIVGTSSDSYLPSPLWYVIHDNLAPRLSGKLGKTLLDLDYTGNYLQLNNSPPPPANNSVSSDYLTLSRNTTSFINFHAGFLSTENQPDNKHFLLANLNTDNNRDVVISVVNNFSGYNNIRFRNTELPISQDMTFEDEMQVTKNIPAGEGYLFQTAPVVKYGGKLVVNDTISTNEELIDDMIVQNGAELIIIDNYTADASITLEGTGFITGTGYFDLTGNGVISSWDRSLFKGKEDNHPKLIWGNHPSQPGVLSYKIYRKKDTPNFNYIATVPYNQTTYTDESVIILTGGLQFGEEIAQYYVTAVYVWEKQSYETNPSNIIIYERTEGDGFEKSGDNNQLQDFTYQLDQNYPNPFNPSTIIKYSIKNNGLVELIIFDILGREVTTLINEQKAAGSYSVEFNSSKLPSGVYLYKLKSGKFVDVKKMILLK